MPIYGYVCSSCGHTFDALQKMNDPRLVDCPVCCEATLRKQLSAPKFRLKGKGWYETDFKTGDKRNLAGEAGQQAGTEKSDKADKADKADKTSKADKVDKTDKSGKTPGTRKSADSKASSA